MERKKRNYSIDEKEKLGKPCTASKNDYDNFESKSNYNSKKKKFTNSTASCGYLSKAVRKMYPSLKNTPSGDPEFKKAIQVARRSYNNYIKGGNDEPVQKKSKFRQAGGGRKAIAIEVRGKYFFRFLNFSFTLYTYVFIKHYF